MKLFSHFYLGSFIYALFFTFCLYKNANGITYPFFVGGTLFFFCYCLKKSGITAKKDSIFYMVSLLLLGLSSFITDSAPIVFMNTVGIFILFFSFIIHCFYDDSRWNFSKQFSSVFMIAFGSISCLDQPFRYFNQFLKTRNMDAKKIERNKKGTAILLGILIAIPLLIVVTALLYSADVIFARLFNDFFSVFKFTLPENLLGITAMFLFAFFASSCIWIYLNKKELSEEVSDKRTKNPLTAITFTGILSVIYLLFSFIQIRYLFLGDIPASHNFTYSEYARQGFFQLLFVCLINLVLVLICLGRFQDNRILKIILTIITVCTYIMIASSVMRMLLYIFYYNLTFLRILVLWALFIIFILITGVIISIYKPGFPLFRFSMITVTVLYLLFSFSHPDYWIARYNIEPHTRILKNENIAIESVIDYGYLSQLSSDAAPVLLAPDSPLRTLLRTADGSDHLYMRYVDRISEKSRTAKDDFRTFNLSRAIASRLLPPAAGQEEN